MERSTVPPWGTGRARPTHVKGYQTVPLAMGACVPFRHRCSRRALPRAPERAPCFTVKKLTTIDRRVSPEAEADLESLHEVAMPSGMHTRGTHMNKDKNHSSHGGQAVATAAESRAQRGSRLLAHEGGPLIGWLFDEARRRGIDLQDMAGELGVTYGYINQLRRGIRETCRISRAFASACATFLGVPTVVVHLLSGFLSMEDFLVPGEPEEERVDRAIRQLQDDPAVRACVHIDLTKLGMDGKRAMLAMYAHSTGKDLLGLHDLPVMVRWLQRAAVIHDESEFEAARGHRDTLMSAG